MLIRTALALGLFVLLWLGGLTQPVLAAGASLGQPAASAISLTGLTHEWQTVNNCGPAVLAMNLNYYGGSYSQASIATSIRPSAADQNVRPDELARYAVGQGWQATLRVNGTPNILRLLLSNGIPVLIETWESDDPTKLDDGFAHFRLVTGYDDARQTWIVYDSYFARDLVNPGGEYQGMLVSYARAAELWRITNHKYVLIYPAEKAAVVEQILGRDLDDNVMWQGAEQQAHAELAQQPADRFAWFNLGSSLFAQGKNDEAIVAFQKAQSLGLPQRMLWYQYEPLEAYYASGHYQAVLDLADQALRSASGIEELHYWKALALAALGDRDLAQRNLQEALAINSHYEQALAALDSMVRG
jgi:tetratricopeptide (TPR) repeat protein